jgi:cytochrome c oxidase subunit 4
MASTKLYAAIYVALFVVATVQVVLEGFLDANYWPVFGAIMVVSLVKAGTVAGYYMHLREEPRAVSYLMLVGLFGALALTIAAAYSIL